MAARITRGNQRGTGNELAQRLGGGASSSAKPTSLKPVKRTSRSNTANGIKDSNNPLLARLDNKPKTRSSTKRAEPKKSDANPLEKRIRSINTIPKGPALTQRLNLAPAKITKQVETLRTQKLRSSTKNFPNGKITKKDPIRNKTILKIKNASNPSFLKIKNLEYGTSTSDLRTVLENIGKIKSLKIKDLESGSSIAEVSFISETSLQKAHNQLNGAIADGRNLKTEITNDSEINQPVQYFDEPRPRRSHNSRWYN